MPVVLGLGFTPAICTFIATGLAQETDIHAQLVARLEHIPGTGCRVLIMGVRLRTPSGSRAGVFMDPVQAPGRRDWGTGAPRKVFILQQLLSAECFLGNYNS